MAKEEPVNEKMSPDFSKISLKPDGTEPDPAKVKKQLASERHRYAVFVSDALGGSHTVVRMFDSTSGHYSDLKTGSHVLMRDILNTKEIMLGVSKPEVPGVTVVEGGEPVGVLSRDVLMQSFTEQSFAVRTQLQGDWELHGDISLHGPTGKGKAYSIICAKPGCNTLNSVIGFDPGRTLCVNGHVLEVASN
jgi:hypothetical protein